MMSNREHKPEEINNKVGAEQGSFPPFPVTPWFFERNSFPRLGLGGLWSPRIDMVDKDNVIIITVELPGVDPKDVQYSIAKDVITIEGERRTSSDEQSGGYRRRERSYGKFRRDIELPKNLNMEDVEATFEKGELIITLPKLAGQGPTHQSYREQ